MLERLACVLEIKGEYAFDVEQTVSKVACAGISMKPYKKNKTKKALCSL